MQKKKTNIITISGKAGAGKDTFATILASRLEANSKKVYCIAYADLVKFIATKYYGWNGEKDEVGRSLLQTIGTNAREVDPDFWVNAVVNTVNGIFVDADYVLITDTRYRNEIEVWRDKWYNLSTVRVVRPQLQSKLTAEQQMHPSECELDDYSFTITVINDEDDFDNLYEEADALIIAHEFLKK